jgi:hypothetical protein
MYIVIEAPQQVAEARYSYTLAYLPPQSALPCTKLPQLRTLVLAASAPSHAPSITISAPAPRAGPGPLCATYGLCYIVPASTPWRLPLLLGPPLVGLVAQDLRPVLVLQQGWGWRSAGVKGDVGAWRPRPCATRPMLGGGPQAG